MLHPLIPPQIGHGCVAATSTHSGASAIAPAYLTIAVPPGPFYRADRPF
jgi:hypothetical protein